MVVEAKVILVIAVITVKQEVAAVHQEIMVMLMEAARKLLEEVIGQMMLRVDIRCMVDIHQQEVKREVVAVAGTEVVVVLSTHLIIMAAAVDLVTQ